MFTEAQLRIVHFCSVECKFQCSGEESVSWMVNAYNWAAEHSYTPELGFILPTPDDLRIIGTMVEPVKNKYGYRRQSVWVRGNEKAPWTLVPQMMVELGETIRRREGTPGEIFYQFENCHPFIDGNGRTGALLYNWLNKTLDNPTWPPDFWHDTRRRPGYGAPNE